MQKRFDILRPAIRPPNRRFLRFTHFLRTIFARHGFDLSAWSGLVLDYLLRSFAAEGAPEDRRSGRGAPLAGPSRPAPIRIHRYLTSIRLNPVLSLYRDRIRADRNRDEAVPGRTSPGRAGTYAPLPVFGPRLERLVLRSFAPGIAQTQTDGAPVSLDSSAAADPFGSSRAAPANADSVGTFPGSSSPTTPAVAQRRVRDFIFTRNDRDATDRDRSAGKDEAHAGAGRIETTGLILRRVLASQRPRRGLVEPGEARRSVAGLRIITLAPAATVNNANDSLPTLFAALDTPPLPAGPGTKADIRLVHRRSEAVGVRASAGVNGEHSAKTIPDAGRPRPAASGVNSLSPGRAAPADPAREAANFARALRELPSPEIEGLADRIYLHLERKMSRELDRRGLA